MAKNLLPRLDASDFPEDIIRLLKSPEKLPHITSLAATAFQVVRLWPDHQPMAFRQMRYAIASREPLSVYPAFVALRQFIENATVATKFPSEIKELLLHACEQRTQPGLSFTLNLLGDMFERGQLNGDDIDRLSSALRHVLNEYRYDQKNLEVPAMADLPRVRREVHRLSEMLSNYCSDLKDLKSELEKDPLPEVRNLKLMYDAE
ncbi:hypothetical protein ACVNHC_03970 [Pannonibacter sp. Q-1]